MFTKVFQFFLAWLLFAIGSLASYSNDLIGIFMLFFFFFISDFVTGILSSHRQGKKFCSSKARWSFAKMLSYFGTFLVIIFIGICVNQLDFFIGILKITVWAGIWFEAVSNIENLLILFPNARIIKFVHYLLAVEWVSKIPFMSNFLKEEKVK